MPQIILGLPMSVFWFWFSAAIYGVSIILIWKPLRKEKSELVYAFFAFLAGMALLHLFVGAGIYWKQMWLIHIGFLGGLVGAVYTLKFPLLALSEPKRKPLFYTALLAALLTVLWMFLFPHKGSTMIWVGYIFMIFTSGVIASSYIILWGIKSTGNEAKIKGIGGGIGMFTCCFLADILVLYTLFFSTHLLVVSGHFFMWLAPIIVIFFVYLGRVLQEKHIKITG